MFAVCLVPSAPDDGWVIGEHAEQRRRDFQLTDGPPESCRPEGTDSCRALAARGGQLAAIPGEGTTRIGWASLRARKVSLPPGDPDLPAAGPDRDRPAGYVP